MSNYLKAAWDAEQSTFMQIIYFTNDKFVKGYSKRIGFEEVKSQDNLLVNWILRNYRSGYLNPESRKIPSLVDYIEFYYRVKGRGFQLCFTLYQNFVEWEEEYYRDNLNTFLDEFYKLKSIGVDPYGLLYRSAKSRPSYDLDLKRKRFFNKEYLREYCLRIFKNNTRTLGEVMDFYRDYCSKFLSPFDQTDKEFFNGINFG